MKKPKLLLAGAAFMLTLVALLGINHGDAFAATKTWTGGGSDANWNTSANWSPSGAPTSGDDLVFNLTSPNSGGTNNISGLSVKTITASGTSNNLFISGQALTVTESIINTGTVKSLSTDTTLTLGADVTIKGVSISNNVGTATLALNGYTLTVLDASDATDSSAIALRATISGNGGIVINAPLTAVSFRGASTYSGTTNIIASRSVSYSSPSTIQNVFGSSSIIIGPNAYLYVDAQGLTSGDTWNNPITVQQTAENKTWFQGGTVYLSIFFASPVGTSPFTLNVPHLTLEGNTRFGANSFMTVNLAGIQSNGFCIQYGNVSNNAAEHFVNGPAACVVSAAAPATPDTGFEMITSNPFAVLGASIACAAAIIFLARRYATNS